MRIIFTIVGAMSGLFLTAALFDFFHQPLTIPSTVISITSAGLGAVFGRIADALSSDHQTERK